MSLSSVQRLDYNLMFKDVHDPNLSYDDFSKGFLLKHLCELKQYDHMIIIKSIMGSDIKGNNINLLQAVGTIFDKTTIRFSFPVSYPRHPPCVTMDLPEGGIIRNTSVFDPYGEVSASLPYLRDWNFRESSVLSLLLNLKGVVDRKNLVLYLTFDGVLSDQQAKLARLLVANGRKDLYEMISRLPKNEHKRAVFDKVIARYRPNKDLAKHIETKKDGIKGFIKIVEATAESFLKFLPTSEEGASSSTHGLLHSLGYPLDPGHLSRRLFHIIPYIEKDGCDRDFSSLFTHSVLYDDKDCIERQLSELFCAYPELEAKTREVDSQGSKVCFIVVEGPVPCRSYVGDKSVDDGKDKKVDGKDKKVDFKYKTVDVTIWLRKSYPIDRPRVYVKCPVGMEIDRNVVNVLASGAVHFSYLQEWVGDRSSLIGLFSHLSAEFCCQSPNFISVKLRPRSSRDDQGGSGALLQCSPRRKLNPPGFVDSGNGSNRSENNFQDISSQFSDALNLDSHTQT